MQQAAAGGGDAIKASMAGSGRTASGAGSPTGLRLSQENTAQLAQLIHAAGLPKETAIQMALQAVATGLTQDQVPLLLRQVKARSEAVAAAGAVPRSQAAGAAAATAAPSRQQSVSSPLPGITAVARTPPPAAVPVGGGASPSPAAAARSAPLPPPNLPAQVAAQVPPVATASSADIGTAAASNAPPAAPGTVASGATAQVPAMAGGAGADGALRAISPLRVKPAAVAQQAWQEQQQLASQQRKQFEGQVIDIGKIWQAEANGLKQTNIQVQYLVQELQAELDGKPKVKEQLAQLLTTQQRVVEVHQMMQARFAELDKTQAAAQQVQLQLSHNHVNGMLNLLHGMNEQVTCYRREVTQLKEIGAQVIRSQEHRMQMTQQEVFDLKQHLDASLHQQEELREQLKSKGSQASVEEAAVESAALRQRILALEEEVASFIKVAEQPEYDSEEEWV